MAKKPFEIQDSRLRMGGVDLQAGTTGVVIPGVTQATSYTVEEVDETDVDQTNTLNLPIVIDNVTHVAKVADAGASVSAYATYTVQLDDEDYVDEIEVNTAGTYVGSEVDRNGDFDMWGYTGSDAEGYLTNWVTGDWVQIPFRPKMRVGDVELEGGSGSLEDIQVTRDDEDGQTELTLADKDFNIRTTRSNPGQDADIGIYAADDLWLEAAGDEVSITAANEVTIYTNNVNSSHEWIFNASGHVQFPDGSVQVTAYTGTGDDNIWIETFASDAPSADFVQGATSVEYDNNGNVIALLGHYEPSPDSSYTSVAKLTPTGAVLWQVRFGANLYTDGWGLAYDTVDDIVYVAGRTSGTPLTYEFATLTKLNGTFGNIIWSKTYDFEADSTSAVVDVDGDGNPVMVGYSYNGTDNYIITTKIDKTDGSVVWSKTLDGQGDEQAYGMAVGPSNEIVTIGYASQLGATDAAATLYTDPVSNPNWTLTAVVTGSSGATYTVSFTDGVPTFTNINDPVGGRTVDSILDTISGVSFSGTSPADDMIVKVGTLAAADTDDRMVVIKYANDGTIAWQKAVQFDAGYDCRGADADIDSAGNIYVCGSYQYDYQTSTTSAMSLVKFDSSGVKQWSRRVVGNCDTFGTSVVVGDDDQVYLSGITGNDNTDDYTWVVAKYNTDGVVTWQRLIDNTTTWSFGGSFWFSSGGGSNIAVKNGYVALAGAFGDPGTQPIAVVVQIDTDATPFSVGDWDFKGASFSGLLNGTASDITVVNANKPLATVSPAVGTFASGEDLSNFLSVTRYGLGSVGTGDVTFNQNTIIGTGDAYGGDGLNLAPGPNLAADMHFRIHGGDTPTHLHLSVGNTAVYDQYFGTDSKFLVLGLDGNISIGTNGNNWQFGTDGSTTFPTLTVPISDNATPNGTGQTLKFKDPTQQAIIFGPASTLEHTSAERVIIQGAPGYTDTTGEGGDIYLWAGPGGSAGGDGGDIKIRAGRGQVAGQGGYLNFQAGNTTSGYGGYINIESGSSNTANQGGNVTITANSGGQLQLYTEQNGNITLNTASGGNIWTLSSTGVTTLPGAVIKGTAAKTYVLGTGIPTVLGDSGWLTALVDGSYGPFTGSLVGIVYTVNVAGGVAAYSIVSHTGVIANNTTIDQLDASALGGASGNLSNISITAVNDTVALDLAKSINKLAEGSYTLADGVEGQIMYLVRQTAAVATNITVTVANARVNGVVYTLFDQYPFDLGLDSTVDISTLIFTDGAWQAVGGTWN